MWIIYALIVHMLLLGSIFVIYFRSPVITGLEPQKPLTVKPPADRLVLIVTDGLRAESFFEDNCKNVPHLKKLFPQQGLVGVSRTHVPTESRPGHIALIAGLYEDPSAVTRGWKENPIEFDTLFNRSGHTYAWGANDVLHIFSRLADGGRPMHFDAYDHDLDFSGKDKTYELDEWVFERVRLLLRRKRNELRKAKKVVFFLHLLGLDTAGHVHKPGTELFLENLHQTERGIVEIYETFEKTFPDNRTAYVLTSDHGMTNAGSHGAGDPHETDTPFYLWGAGVAKYAPDPIRTFSAGDNIRLPLYELEQAQLAPLMSALIGLPPPMNNFGVLPLGYLNASAEYEAHAAHSNALQLLAQFQILQKQHQSGLFSNYLRKFDQLQNPQVEIYKTLTKKHLETGQFEESVFASTMIMYTAIKGIEYYHGYYLNMLLFSTSAAFLGWIFYLQQLLMQKTYKNFASPSNIQEKSRFGSILCILIALTCIVWLQGMPLAIGFYLILPVFTWMLYHWERTGSHTKQRSALPLGQILVLIACAELLVFTFYERRLISLAYVLFACVNNFGKINLKERKCQFWIVLVCVLPLFPVLPASVGYQNTALLACGILLSMVILQFAKTQISLRLKLINLAGLFNAAICIYLHTHQLGVPLMLRIFSWCFLVYTITTILLDKTVTLTHRVKLIFFNLTALYSLLCTSYESLFIQLLAIELTFGISLQKPVATALASLPNQAENQMQSSFRLAFLIILYTFFSFFGTGNIASISSFDPNIIRCFLSTFSPFVIMALVILKLTIPVVLNISIIFGLSEFARRHERTIFICMLLICDVMGLNFLFFVRNRGSWLEIGSSISHFVIMQVTTVVLLLITCLAKLFLRMPLFAGMLKTK